MKRTNYICGLGAYTDRLLMLVYDRCLGLLLVYVQASQQKFIITVAIVSSYKSELDHLVGSSFFSFLKA